MRVASRIASRPIRVAAQSGYRRRDPGRADQRTWGIVAGCGRLAAQDGSREAWNGAPWHGLRDALVLLWQSETVAASSLRGTRMPPIRAKWSRGNAHHARIAIAGFQTLTTTL